jgi:hypothetical protein
MSSRPSKFLLHVWKVQKQRVSGAKIELPRGINDVPRISILERASFYQDGEAHVSQRSSC